MGTGEGCGYRSVVGGLRIAESGGLLAASHSLINMGN